ncbi:MAG: hypothetical protein COA44_13665 [Arcobacter sp.]|nr:MAG: hypothetical protein COA44_13665 [Arcobacter sp.]
MFNFFRKLFKALNSSGKSWQLSGAIVLAMFTGFLPSNSLLMFDFLFLALIFNLNFGLFLLFSVIFSGIGYLFDPVFESIGYSVLTNESLNGFFTSLYNSVLFRWSAFNYTLVTGSLIVSAVLALPLMFVLNKVISLYRVQIGEKLNEWKLTRWMKLFNEESTSTSVFRWWGLGVFGGLSAIILIFMLLLFDPLAKMGIEKGLSYTLKSQVTLKDFSSSLTNLSVSLSGLEIADKDNLSHNLVQIDKIAFDLGLSALVEKKLMIELLKVKELSFDVKRKTVAQAYEESKDTSSNESTSSKESVSSTLNPFTLPNVDDILAKEELKTLRETKALKEDIKATKNKWTKISDDLKKADEVSQIKADAKKLENSLKGGNLSKIASLSKDVTALKTKIQNLKTRYAKLQKEFIADQKNIQKRIMNLKSLPSQDINRLKKKYSLNAGGGANLVGTLIDDKIGNYMKMALKYYEMAKPYISEDKTEKVEEVRPPRGQGRWIKYANHSNIPELLVKKAEISVKLKDDMVLVNVKDLSSNQKLYAKPMIITIDAKGSEYKSIKANIIDDRREDLAKTDFNIKVYAFKKTDYTLGSMSMKDSVSDMVFKGQILDKDISAKSSIKVKKVNISMPSQDLVNKLLKSIHAFKIEISLKGDVSKPSIKVKSDLDKQLSSGLKSMASKVSKDFEKKLKEGVMKKVSGSSDGLSSNLGGAGSLLNSKQDALSGINLDTSSSSNPLKGLMSF